MTKKLLISFLVVLGIIILAGMYKFNYLAGKVGYDADGNKEHSMSGMSCHKMGGQSMGDCEYDENGTIIPSDKNMKIGMNDNGDIFSEDVKGLPDVVPTRLVKLKDGDTFEMVAEMVQQEVGNRTIKRLAYNRMIPGPIIEVEKGANINIKFTNKIDVNTTLHSHGLRLDDYSFDGVPDTMGGTQREMKPGDSFEYKLNFPDTGIYWYHPHIREDYTQEMGLYGNYHVTEGGYWNQVKNEKFLVLDDFSENDPFYKDLTNKTLMGRFGNIMLINNDEDYTLELNQYETTRFYVTNTANTRTFDFKIMNQDVKIVGGDIGRVEQEYMTDSFVIAPAERYIFEARFDEPGEYKITSHGKNLGTVRVKKSNTERKMKPFDTNLRNNTSDYAVIRNDIQKYVNADIDKKLRITIGMQGMGEMRRGMNHRDGQGKMMGGTMQDMMEKEESMGGKIDHDEDGGIEWEDGMKMMNNMSNSGMMEWSLVDETDVQDPQKNMDIDWTFEKDDMVKIEIYNDPDSMHPMQHPIHFHGQRFIVLSRDGVVNDNLQWKDTTLLRNSEKIEILLNTTNVGTWMAHCHIAEHLHAGMMFNFNVE